jgi:hypothetical protein
MSQTVLTAENWQEMLTVTDAMGKRLASFEKAASDKAAAVDNALKTTVAELVKYACIDEVQADQTYTILRDHEEALKFIQKMASRQADTQLGSPAPVGANSAVKRASHLTNHMGDFLQTEASVNLLQQSRNWRS